MSSLSVTRPWSSSVRRRGSFCTQSIWLSSIRPRVRCSRSPVRFPGNWPTTWLPCGARPKRCEIREWQACSADLPVGDAEQKLGATLSTSSIALHPKHPKEHKGYKVNKKNTKNEVRQT